MTTASFVTKVESIIKKDIEKQIDTIEKGSDIANSNEFIDVITTFIKRFSILDSLIQVYLKKICFIVDHFKYILNNLIFYRIF